MNFGKLTIFLITNQKNHPNRDGLFWLADLYRVRVLTSSYLFEPVKSSSSSGGVTSSRKSGTNFADIRFPETARTLKLLVDRVLF